MNNHSHPRGPVARTSPSSARHWRRPAAVFTAAGLATSGLLAGAALGVTAPTAHADTNSTVIGSFEPGSPEWFTHGWTDSAGSVEAGHEIITVDDAPDGTHVARVWVDAAAAEDPRTGFNELHHDLSDPPDTELTGLQFSIKAPDLYGVWVKYFDAHDETFQRYIPLEDSPDWQQIVVPVPAPDTFDHWGGNADNTSGLWEDPLTRVGIVLSTSQVRDPLAQQAEILIDAIKVLHTTVDPSPSPGIGELLGGFETAAEGWSTAGHPAQFERVLTDEAPQGTHIAQLTLDVPETGFTEFIRTVGSLEFEQLSFQIRTDALSQVVVRLTDHTGQTHQSSYPLEQTGNWQSIVITDPTDGGQAGHWGGADDGQWHERLAQVSILIDTGLMREPRPASLTIDIDDVRLLSPSQAAAELAFDQRSLGNVFVAGEAAVIGYSSTAELVTWRLRDVHGSVIDSGQDSPAGGEGEIAVDIGNGWYQLEATATSGDEILGEAVTTLARIPGHHAGDSSPFGVATHYGGGWWELDSIPLLAPAGVATIRDEIYWGALERQPGVYDWSITDWVDPVSDAGLDLLLIPGYGNQLYDDGDGPTSTEGIAAYARYAAALADRYQNQSAGIEIWNEWEITIGNTTVVDPESYVELLKVASPAVRQVAPDLPIIGPATVFMYSSWLPRTFELGALDYIDGVVLHAYNYPRGAEELDAGLTYVNDLIREHNDGETMPIWVTEHGWPTGTYPSAVSEQEQANNLTKAAAIAVAHDVETYIWYDFENDGVDDAENEHNFGLIHHRHDELGAYTPKPAYTAYATATRMLDAAEYVDRDETTDGLWHLQYRTGDSADANLRVLWSETEKSVSVTSAAGFTVVDQYGHEASYGPTPPEGRVLPVGESPIYLLGAVETVSPNSSSLHIDSAFVGQPLELSWTADNSQSSQAADFTLALPGLAENLVQTVPAGEVATLSFTLPAPTQAGPLRITAEMSVAGSVWGTLVAHADVAPALSISGVHTIDPEGVETLRLRVANHADQPSDLMGLNWSLASDSGLEFAGTRLEGGETLTLDLPLAQVDLPAEWSARARFEGGGDLQATGRLLPVATVHDLPHGSIVVNGQLEEAIDHEPILLTRGDPEDLEASVWITWDEEHLNFSAAVLDDVHDQPGLGANIWQGDSFQFTFAPGAPGERRSDYHEIGVALTSQGPQLHRWLPNDVAGTIPGSQVEVVRDDDRSLTTYEVTIPWSQLSGWNPADGLAAIAIALNESDGDGRVFTEWGGGIVESKDPSLFQAVRTLPAADDGEEPGGSTPPALPEDWAERIPGSTDALRDLPDGGLTVLLEGDNAIISGIPLGDGQWSFVFAYSDPTDLGAHQVAEQSVVVDVSSLSSGTHVLAVFDSDLVLLGYVSIELEDNDGESGGGESPGGDEPNGTTDPDGDEDADQDRPSTQIPTTGINAKVLGGVALVIVLVGLALAILAQRRSHPTEQD